MVPTVPDAPMTTRTLAHILQTAPIVMMIACSGAHSSSDVRERIAVDLCARMADARIEDADAAVKRRDRERFDNLSTTPWGPDSPYLVTAGFVMDRAKKHQRIRQSIWLSAHRGAPVEMRIGLGDGPVRDGTLEFSLASIRRASPRAARRLIITFSHGGASIPLYDSARDEHGIPDSRWRGHAIALPRGAGAHATLALRFESDADRPEHLFVGGPRIVTPTREAPTNVVFVIVDAMRADCLNALADRYAVTPVMDVLARDGVLFERHIVAANWTRPSTIAMLGSCSASAAGVNLFYPAVHDEERAFFYRESGVTLLPTLLKRAGHLTRAIGNNPFIIDYSGIGVDCDLADLSEYSTSVADTTDITEETVAWLGENARRPFFLFMNYNAPHNPYSPPARFYREAARRFPGADPMFNAYLGEIAYTDEGLGRVIAALKRLGLYENTLIIVTSDHGEIFSHDRGSSPFTGADTIYTHGQTQFDEELHTPLIVKFPAAYGYAGKRVAAQVRSIDIAPTVLEALGLSPPDSFQGRSLFPLVRGEERQERIAYSEGRRMYSVRYGGYKYAERFTGFGLKPEHWGGEYAGEYAELYDLSADPRETRNLAADLPETAGRMRALLRHARFKQPDNVLFSNGAPARGRVRIENGFFYSIATTGAGSSSRALSRRECEFSLPAGGSLVFQTIPGAARVAITAAPATPLLCGRNLLPLAARSLGGTLAINGEDRALHGRPEPAMLALAGRALLFWHEGAKSSVREVKREKYLSADINVILKDWGYIQGKERTREED